MTNKIKSVWYAFLKSNLISVLIAIMCIVAFCTMNEEKEWIDIT